MADKLELSRASVSNMMDVLVAMKLITRGKMGEVYFTDMGASLADKQEMYYEKIKGKLFPNIMSNKVDKAICAFLAELPESILEDL